MKNNKKCNCIFSINKSHVYGTLTALTFWGSFYFGSLLNWDKLGWYHPPYIITCFVINIIFITHWLYWSEKK